MVNDLSDFAGDSLDLFCKEVWNLKSKNGMQLSCSFTKKNFHAETSDNEIPVRKK